MKRCASPVQPEAPMGASVQQSRVAEEGLERRGEPSGNSTARGHVVDGSRDLLGFTMYSWIVAERQQRVSDPLCALQRLVRTQAADQLLHFC